MNLFINFWNWLKSLFFKKYTKEQFIKKDILDFLDKKLPNKKVMSLKDIVDKLKELVK